MVAWIWFTILVLFAGVAWFAFKNKAFVTGALVACSLPLWLALVAVEDNVRGKSVACDPADDARQILGYQVDEPNNILYLMLDGPILCHMPYSDFVVQKIQDGLEAGGMVEYGGGNPELIDIKFPEGEYTK